MAVKVAKIFQSGMVLQREMPVRVWGYGKPDEKIKVSIQGECAETLVEADGRWSLELPPLAESSRETMVIVCETDQMELKDIAVGEVFVAAGQSNMEFWLKYEKHYQEILPSYENQNIRFYDMPKLAYDGQEKDFDYHKVGIWRKASKENLAYFSAVGFYFAKKLEKDLSVPIGIIGCNWGGTKSLAWMREDHAREIQKEQTEDFEIKLNGRNYGEFCRTCGNNPMNDTGNSTWNPFNEFILPQTPSMDEIMDFLRSDQKMGSVMEAAKPQDAPGMLYRHMVQRLAPYTVRAILWYQGESDDEIDGTQKNYKKALDTIKRDWRDAWENPALPFFIVQLPGFYSWFGCDILADAPRLAGIKREGRKLTLIFENAEGGLFVEGDKVEAFSVTSGEDEIAYTEMIAGETIILNLPSDRYDRLTVQFACDGWYRVNLYNQAGIPAIPFKRTC
ncbi:sialate O-acetylesterase [Roseburia hominis]